MKSLRIGIIMVLAFCAFLVKAQEQFVQQLKVDNRLEENRNIKWDDSLTLTKVSEEDKKNVAFYVKKHYVKEYTLEFVGNSGMLFLNETHHVRVVVNNDEGVEYFNKMYIPMYGMSKLHFIKARVISPKGKIKIFDESKKKEIENYENYGPFTILALEGVEVGSEIEYIYYVKRLVGGSRTLISDEVIQQKLPIREAKFDLIVPDFIGLSTKSYNGIPEFVTDTIVDSKCIRYSLKVDSLEAFEEEKYSLGEALMGRVEYRWKKDSYKSLENKNSYQEHIGLEADFYYKTENKRADKKEIKAAKKLLKTLGLKGKSDKEKIVGLEHYIKDKVQTNAAARNYFVHDLVQHNEASIQAKERVLIRVLDLWGIDHQLVYTGSRFDRVFDENFETPNFLGKVLVYFPKFDLYTDPASDILRLGIIPAAFAYQKGVFMKRVSVGGYTNIVPEIKEIRGLNSNVHYDNMVLDVSINPNFEKLNVDLNLTASGYSASFLRPFLPEYSEEDRKEVLESKLKIVGKDAIVTKAPALTNDKMEGFLLEKPLGITGSVEIASLLEKAGPKYLVKIGQVIGPQVEMYQEKERKSGVENTYNHGYKRTINFKIPKGYKISNLKDLKMDFFSKNKDKRTMEFSCDYKLKGNILTIDVVEYYDEIRVSKSRFEEFRSVINAAADFNKKILVLEKQ